MTDNNPRLKRKKTKKFGNPLAIPCLVLLGTTLVLLIVCILISIGKKSNAKTETIPSSYDDNDVSTLHYLSDEEIDRIISSASENAAREAGEEYKNNLMKAMSVPNANIAEYLRSLFDDKIVYYTNEGYKFDDISSSIPANSFKRGDFKKDEAGFLTYVGDDSDKYKIGIDVSSHQGEIDWAKVKEAGIEFAIIRMGFRGYGSGALVVDETFEQNIKGALSNNIPVGIYFFSQAINMEEQAEEIAFLLEAISPYKITYPVAIDIEKVDDKSARGNNISRKDRTSYVKHFCEEVKKAGYTPMIYGNTYSLFAMLDISELFEYSVWFAFYNDYIYYPYSLSMWQYSESLEIPGIKGTCDVDILIP